MPEKEIEKSQEEIQDQSERPMETLKQTPIKLLSPKKERISLPEPEPVIQSPVLQKLTKVNDKINDKTKNNDKIVTPVNDEDVLTSNETQAVEVDTVLDKTKVISVENSNMDKTVVLPNGVYNHAPVTPKNVVSGFFFNLL